MVQTGLGLLGIDFTLGKSKMPGCLVILGMPIGIITLKLLLFTFCFLLTLPTNYHKPLVS